MYKDIEKASFRLSGTLALQAVFARFLRRMCLASCDSVLGLERVLSLSRPDRCTRRLIVKSALYKGVVFELCGNLSIRQFLDNEQKLLLVSEKMIEQAGNKNKKFNAPFDDVEIPKMCVLGESNPALLLGRQ